MIHDSILKLIGNTPIVRIQGNVYAKLEGCNPGGSIKDRIAIAMIESAERSGSLTKDKTIIEPTSGNTGIGLAMVAAVKGYNIEIVMCESASIERRKMLEGLGAKVILTPADEETDGAIRLCNEMVARHPEKYFMPDQYGNASNWNAHYNNTAEEIIKDLPSIGIFVAGLGTSGTLMGCARRLKEHNSRIRIVAVQPETRVEGLKNLATAKKPKIYDPNLIDRTIKVAEKDAMASTRTLMKQHGIIAGASGGAAMHAALQIAEDEPGTVILAILPDRAEKYLSTSLIMPDKMSLKIFNTATRSKQEFVPLEKEKVKMYTCGPTVYDYAHIGNFRSFSAADLLKRWLKYKGFKVTHVMNITDVEDKIIKATREQGRSLKEFTEYFTDEFFKDYDALRLQRPDHVPRATDTIEEMVHLVQMLLKKGFAYKSQDGSIYFDIAKFSKYGEMANLDLKGLKKGARIAHDEYEKEDISDFALWKAYSKDDGDIYWETALGKGRPGWHLECSAMSMKYLGESIDIHTGGIDLVFPHHQNEVAQSEAATGKSFVNYWVHCNHLIVDGRKMSKSLGNFYTLRDLFDKGYSPRALRYILLSTHYRQQLNLTMESLDAAENAIRRIDEFMLRLHGITDAKEHDGINMLIKDLDESFSYAMEDDLAISQALAACFDFMKEINKLVDDGRVGRENAKAIIAIMEKIDLVLGLLKKEEEIPEHILSLAKARLDARKSRDYAESDRLRNEIIDAGYSIDDTKNGFNIKKIRR